ncbi:hypothetical protein [Bdellovibrio sp. HCB-162]|uniref:hypothetical protein n=1 Tax=Bdellovibrio sp. HCB-162 TaxID=3394234 RepID=UPI0039BCBE91
MVDRVIEKVVLPSAAYLFFATVVLVGYSWFKLGQSRLREVENGKFFDEYRKLSISSQLICCSPMLSGPFTAIYFSILFKLDSLLSAVLIIVNLLIFCFFSFVQIKMKKLDLARIVFLIIGVVSLVALLVWSLVESDPKLLFAPVVVSFLISSFLIWLVFLQVAIRIKHERNCKIASA